MENSLDVRAPWFGQFLLSPDIPLPDGLQKWNSWKVEDLRLTVCPSVPVAFASEDGCKVWMLGHAYSGERVETNEELVRRIAQQMPVDGMPEVIEWIVGRFLLIIEQAGVIRIVPDPVATFKALAGRDEQGRFWASSEVKLLQHFDCFRACNDKRWLWARNQKRFQVMTGNIMNLSALEGMTFIPINHSVSNVDGTTPRRVFPTQARAKQSAEMVRNQITNLVQNAYVNAEKAGLELWFSVTSGQDSRFLLSLAMAAYRNKKLKQKPRFYFIQKRDLSIYQQADFDYVNRLINDGWDIEIFHEKPESLLQEWNYNAEKWHSPRCHLTRFLPANECPHFPSNRLFASGITAEITRRWDNEKSCITVKDVAIALKFPNHPFILDALEQFKDNNHQVDPLKYEFFELAYWELTQLFSGAMIHYGNIAMPYWCPMNSWKFYELMLSIPHSERGQPTSRFFTESSFVWLPELSKHPINFHYRNRIINGMKAIGLYRFWRWYVLHRMWWKSGREQKNT
jgi:hypothetical protein